MIDSKHFEKYVKEVFSFLELEFNLILDKIIVNGNALYEVTYVDKSKIISISYENIEDYFQVIIFKLKKGQLPDYDDKANTIHLSVLRNELLTQIDKKEFQNNNLYFKNKKAESGIEKMLLKAAKDLRICLKYYKD